MSYRCQGDTAKFPEGGLITCESGKGIQTPGSKCKVECDIGSPNYAEIECKQTHGWRPTSKLECTGVAPGVVVGVLFGGIMAVILIAYIYAKYKESKKKKELKKNPPPLKKTRSRPGKVNQTSGNKPQKVQMSGPPVVEPAVDARPSPPPPATHELPLDFESQKSQYSAEGSIKKASARGNTRRKTNKEHRNTSRKARIHEKTLPEEDWHFRNKAYAYDEMAPPPDAYQARYDVDPYSTYGSYHQPPHPPPQVGFSGRYSAPPPRPHRESGVYTVPDHFH